jgi:DNA-binding MurR/RpiR family transcriptional regulator
MKAISFFERLRAQEHLTPSEARIVEHMERSFPVLALESVSKICNKAGVGRATVVRFVQKLGYESFSEFQQELRSELAHRLRSPKERFEEKRAQYPQDNPNLFRIHSDQVIENINEANNRIEYEQLQEAAKMLAKCRGRIFVTGHRTSFALAYLFHFCLSYIRNDVMLCNSSGIGTSRAISHISPDDILVLVFKRRYSTVTEKIGNWFAERGCRLILLTDRETNPLAAAATMQFVIPSEGFGIFDSRGATIAVIETIINLVAIELQDSLDERFERAEEAAQAFDVFSSWSKRSSLRSVDPLGLDNKDGQ